MCGLTRSARPARAAAPLDRGPRLLARQPAASVADEERAAADRRDVVTGQQGGARPGDPAAEPVERDLPDRHEPLLVALADDPHERAVDRQVLAVEADRLADPQPGGVEELEQRPVAELVGGVGRIGVVAAGRLEQALGLGHRQRLGEQPRRPWQVEVGGHVRSG